MSKECESTHPGNDAHQPEDPLACFGSDDASSSDDDLVDTHDMKHSRRLVTRANKNQKESTNAPHVPISSPNFEIVDIPSAGKGVRALQPFTRGQEIIREGATMRILNQHAAKSQEEANQFHREAVEKAFELLPSTTKRAFMELSSTAEKGRPATPVGIYQNNSYMLGDNEPYGGLFLTVARFNHSCRPNCNHFWRPDLKQMLLFATRDIAPGEELCTKYGPTRFLITAERQDYLEKRFSFICRCEMCSQANTNGGDDRMTEIDALPEEISLLAASGEPDAALKAVDRGLAILKEQGIETGASAKSLYHYGFKIATGPMGDKILGLAYLRRELAAVEESEGFDSPKALEIQRMFSSIDDGAAKDR